MRAFIQFGAGGHGKVVLDAALRAKIPVAFVMDDAPAAPEMLGVQVVKSKTINWSSIPEFDFIVAVGENSTRARILQELLGRNGSPVNVVHPSACLSSFVDVGRGVVVCAGVVVNPGVRIGDNVIVNTSASVDHDCVIGEHVHICPGVRLAGNVTVGARSMIGIGAVVLPGLTIGADCIIGAGSVVTRDIPDGVVGFGNPARIVRAVEQGKGKGR